MTDEEYLPEPSTDAGEEEQEAQLKDNASDNKEYKDAEQEEDSDKEEEVEKVFDPTRQNTFSDFPDLSSNNSKTTHEDKDNHEEKEPHEGSVVT